MLNHRLILFTTVLLFAACTHQAVAQRLPVHVNRELINVTSGRHSSISGDESDRIVFVHVFTAPHGAPWMRLRVREANLGASSFIVLHSMHDNGRQHLNTATLAQWSNASAIFNGNRVMLELHLGPGDHNVFVTFDQMIYGDPPVPGDEGQLASLCGADDRVASTDNRVGRLYFGGCTAFRTTAGVLLTAGHCVDFDPDQGGPGVPDGVLDLSGVVEFNVPASLANGTTVAANPDDQYPILTNNVAWQFAGSTSSFNSVGRDWAAFQVGPNSNTGLTPEQAYGLPFRLTREVPAVNATLRVTGFGTDTGTANMTNQTSTGPFLGETTVNNTHIFIDHQVDTTPASSGSPLIWNSNGLVIGIHTNGGCTTQGEGANAGTSLEHDTLEQFISTVAAAFHGIAGANVRHVDLNHPLRVAEIGSPYRPYSTFTLAASLVPSGGMISIVAGNYTAAAGNTGDFGTGNKAMLIVAPAGTVTIGE